jgi:cytochrome P450
MKIIQSLKTLRAYRADPIRFISKLKADNGHRSQLNIFGKELIILSHPQDVLHVLKINHAHYSKGRTTRELRKFLGKGLITNEGDSWRKQHRLIRPLMNPKSIFTLAPKIHTVCQEFVEHLEQQRPTNGFHEMNRLTWRIILRTLFSQETTPEMDYWLGDILKLMHIITGKTRSALPLPFWVPTRDHRDLKRIIGKFDKYVFDLITERRQGEKKNDLLQLLIDAQEEGGAMTDHEIRDEVMTFLMAGHETITNSMTWLMIELARHPEYMEKLRPEAAAFLSSSDYEALNSASWMGAVIDESLRLWPPVWVFMRQTDKADAIDSLAIKIKSNVVVAPYLTHRSADLWQRPDDFYPERFLPEAKKSITPGMFYPFGLGPRACIGAYFAGVEARIILATFVHHFDWEITQPEVQSYEAGITLRPTNNIQMRFRRR